MANYISHRLLVSPARWARLRALPESPLLQRAAALLATVAEPWVDDRNIQQDMTAHNAHLVRARQAQTRVVSLLVRYGITGERRYREAALGYLRDIAGWEYWSWITWREGNADPNAIFDLSYGENATTLALAYDWLAAELSPEERELIVDTARARAFLPYLARNGVAGEEMWYYRSPNCNWNTVCNGGVGLLALALGDLLPECATVLALVEEGVRHYFEFLQEDGAWPEGIGYWGYGHRYGYLYLLSHERASGHPHPLLARAGSKATFRFPFLFSPHGVAAGFGDSNTFFALPFIFAGAERFALPDVAVEMDRRLTRAYDGESRAMETDSWPDVAELLLFHPGTLPATKEASPWPCCSVQRGLGWGLLADRWPQPHLYASIRGGTTDAPHTQQDLSSLWVLVEEEPLIDNIGEYDYIDTTFSERRHELYEMSAASKNMLFVNGVGLPKGTVNVEEIHGKDWDGILLDATQAASVGSPVELYTRAVLMLNNAALLILDRVIIKHAGLGEVRFHTRYPLQIRKATALIVGKANKLQLSFTANVPTHLARGMGLPTHSTQQPDNILRLLTEAKNREMFFATLLTPNGEGRVRLDMEKQTVAARGPGFAVKVDYGFGFRISGVKL